MRKYVTTYQEKLARPVRVLRLHADRDPVRAALDAGRAEAPSLGFGLSLAIVFVYYVVMTVCSFAAEAFLPLGARSGLGFRTSSSPRSALDPFAARGAGMNFVEIVRGIGKSQLVMALAGRRRVRRRPRRPSGRAQAFDALRNSPAIHVDDRRDRDRNVHRAGRLAGRDLRVASRSRPRSSSSTRINAANHRAASAPARSRSQGQHRPARPAGRYADGSVLSHHPAVRIADAAAGDDPRLTISSR